MKRILFGLITLMFLGSGVAYAGPYLDSAHGTQNDAITGVKRLSDYTDGNCGHCHEQHASIGGSEPDPTGGPDTNLLFDTSHTSQTANFCFDCHVDIASQQTGGVINNYSYTYRAGGADDTSFTGDDIKEAFSISRISSHSLDNILTFITGKWGYTANSNPCCACHNPHAAQGDPAGSSSYKSSSTRGYPVSRPSLHSNLSSWGLWGDESGEKMSDYTSYYQAPYRYGSITTYEPDDSSITTNGSNLTDFVTFCQDCHSSDMTAAPYNLSNTPIDWSTTGGEGGGDKHGKNIATQDVGAYYVNLLAPYSSAWSSSNGLVLACTDCHEAHGSFTVSMVRKVINGGVASAATWKSVCGSCHDMSAIFNFHHILTLGAPYPGPPGQCAKCHGGGGTDPINCALCHFHGGDDSILEGVLGQTPTYRRTF